MPNIYGGWSIHLPTSWLVALATSDLRVLVYGIRPLHGALRFAHILSMAGFFGVLLLLEVKRLGFFAQDSIQTARRPLFAVMNWTFGIACVSGLLLFLYDPIGIGLHTMFVPKLILIVLGLVHAFWLQRRPAVRGTESLRRIGGGLAIAIWVLVIGASTWNHEERVTNPAAVHRLDPQG